IEYLSSYILGMKEQEYRNLKIKFPDTFSNSKLSGNNFKIKVFNLVGQSMWEKARVGCCME
ncbi:MAG: hypothetical protein Q8879_03045, partial [Candidatus Phytoplasma australasiaticum]|nr:hypothetical protein [Candidatus Phytoplasma australasiaticum]